MIIPSTADILDNISHACDTVIAPAVAENRSVFSVVTTMGHMLRHARVRVEREGQILFDDAAALRPLLGSIAAYLNRLGAAAEGARIDQALATAFRAPGAYPTVDSLAEEAGALRASLYAALKYLQSIRGQYRGTPEYDGIREAIRAYLAWQIGQEAQLINPAFVGFGVRR